MGCVSTPEKHPGQGGPRRGACKARVGGGCWRRWRGDARSRGLRSARSACSGSWDSVLCRSSSDPAGCVCVAEGVGHPSLFGCPPPASQRLSYPVSGLIFHESKWKGITMKIYVCFERGWFPSVGSWDRRFPFPFFIRALGSAGRRGAGGGGGAGSLSARRRADHRAPRLPAGRETGRRPRQRVAPGGAGAGPRLPPTRLCFSLRSPLLLPAPLLLGPRCILCFPFSLPFSWSAETPPSSGPCTLLLSASRASRGKARRGPARPRRRRVPGSVTPASLRSRGPPRSWGRPPSRLPGSLMPRPVA